MLIAMGCSHGSSATHDGPEHWASQEMGVRAKGGDSLTARVPVLIANGQLAEAEALIAQLVAAGLLAQEAERQLQEQIKQRKEQPSPELRPLPPIHSEDLEPESSRRTCWTEMPNYPICRSLPEEYSFHSRRLALEAMKQRLEAKNLTLHDASPAQIGPCPRLGTHYNVRLNGKRAGSIVCCPCCVESEPLPVEWTKCRIVW
ncbi:MAG TPA: hypothetical protein VF815_12280 [Myxococcaceae bacterium]